MASLGTGLIAAPPPADSAPPRDSRIVAMDDETPDPFMPVGSVALRAGTPAPMRSGPVTLPHVRQITPDDQDPRQVWNGHAAGRQATGTTPVQRLPATASNAAGFKSKTLPVHASGPLSHTGTVILPAGPETVTIEPQGNDRCAVQAFTHHGIGWPSQVAGRIGYQEARPVGLSGRACEETGSAPTGPPAVPPGVGVDTIGSGGFRGGFAGGVSTASMDVRTDRSAIRPPQGSRSAHQPQPQASQKR